MQILNLRAADLFSYQHLDLPLANRGLVLLEGINHDDGGANGVGKTSIFKALCWTLYGDSLSRVRADDVIRLDVQTKQPVTGGTFGEVELDLNGHRALVTRHRQHRKHRNKLLLTIDGTDKTGATDRDTQDCINELLQLDAKSFLTTVLFPQNAVGFAAGTDADQKAVLEKILSLERFAGAQTRQKAEVARIETDVRLSESHAESLDRQLKESEANIHDLDLKERDFYTRRTAEIARFGEQVLQLQSQEPIRDPSLEGQKAALEAKVKERRRIETVVNEAERALNERQQQVSRLRGQAQQLGQMVGLDCQTGQLAVLPSPEPPNPPESVEHYERCLRDCQTNCARATFHIDALGPKVAKLEEAIRNGATLKQCGTCGQDLTPEAKKRLFGSLEEELDANRLQLTSYTGQLETNRSLLASATEVLDRARAHRVWEETRQARKTAQDRLDGLNRDIALRETEVARFLQVTQTARQSLQSLQDCDAALYGVQQTIQRQNAAWSLWEHQISTARSQLRQVEDSVSPYGELLTRAKTNREALATRKGETAGKLVTLRDQLPYASFWVQGFSRSGVISLLLDRCVPELNTRANQYLEILCDGKAHIEFSTQTTLANGEKREKFGVNVSFDHGGGQYGMLSGGELRRVDVAILLALGDLAASRAKASVSIRMLDEPFDSLDACGKEKVVQLLKEKVLPHAQTVLVMSHDDELKSLFDRRIVVTKQGGVSSVADA